MRISRHLCRALALLALAVSPPATGARAADVAPGRVVSLNLCTDQLAMLLAAPGQLVSVSRLARDPRSAALAPAAQDWPVNDGSAEEVVLLQPDLILAGTWTTRATVDMLERLGHRVERFAPIESLQDARANITRMGALLGRPAQAARMLAAFDARLAAQRAQDGRGPRALIYGARGFVAGADTVTGDILQAAGFDNIAAELGLPSGGRLSLEQLVLADPDMVLVGRPYGGHAQATELLAHPVLSALGEKHVIEDGADWTCELPNLLDAVDRMIALRRAWAGETVTPPAPPAADPES